MSRARPYAVAPLLVVVLLLGGVSGGCGAGPTPEAEPERPASTATSSVASPSPSPSPDEGSERLTRTPAPRQPTASISVPAELRSTAPDVEILGGDMSWPQCPPGTGIAQKQGQGSPYPLSTAKYVVLGLTNGPGFTPNPCLADQLAFVEQRGLQGAAYSVISYPGSRTLARVGSRGPYDAGTGLGRLRNAGYSQALYNIATMKRVGLRTPIVWLDVEPVPDFDWPDDPAANAAVVVGATRGYRDHGYPVGVYSTASLWQRVVGDLRLGLPEWRAAGETSRAEARRRCGSSRMFQSGPAVLSQWVEAGRDQDITCPGTSVRMAIWFHQY